MSHGSALYICTFTVSYFCLLLSHVTSGSPFGTCTQGLSSTICGICHLNLKRPQTVNNISSICRCIIVQYLIFFVDSTSKHVEWYDTCVATALASCLKKGKIRRSTKEWWERRPPRKPLRQTLTCYSYNLYRNTNMRDAVLSELLSITLRYLFIGNHFEDLKFIEVTFQAANVFPAR
jgi:hypothetical protein